MDTNKVWLSGLVISRPILTSLAISNTPFTTFLLRVNENFVDKQGRPRSKPSILRIESLGKNAESTYDKVKEGQRYFIDGYLRQTSNDEKQNDIRVRTFAVYREESLESTSYDEGLKQAMEILKRSLDLKSAMQTLQEVIVAK